jgi:hypothetical protein
MWNVCEYNYSIIDKNKGNIYGPTENMLEMEKVYV